MMRISSLTRVIAPLTGVADVLAGCTTDQNSEPSAAGPCAVTDPGEATGYRSDLHAAVVGGGFLR